MGMRRNKVVEADPPKVKEAPEPSRIEKTRSIKHCHQTSFQMGLVPMFMEFTKWLDLHGAVRQNPTNAHEAARYRVLDGTIIVYRKDNGKMTFVNGAGQLYQDFKQGRGYSLSPEHAAENPEVKPVPILNRKHAPGRRRLLASRDGLECWYCSRPLALEASETTAEFATIEEVLSRSLGGPTTPENQVLACGECNKNAGSKSVADKVRMRDRMRGYGVQSLAPPPPPDRNASGDPVQEFKEAVIKEATPWLTPILDRLARLLRRSSS